MRQNISTVITDLDNTLWDWVEIWHRSFAAMLDRLVSQSGIPRDQLEREIRVVHQRHGTSEYAFLIEELPSLQRLHPESNLVSMYADAIAAYRDERNQALTLYDGVRETLGILRDRGCLLIGYTESMAFYTNFRLRKTSLDEILDQLYSPADHEVPRNIEDIRKYPSEYYKLRRTIHKHTPPGELKPNPHILRTILAEVGVEASEALYVGDSKVKDVLMAQDVGVLDVWAEYGVAQHRDAYELLRRVSHWTDTAVETEKRVLATNDIVPSAILHNSFAELLDMANFVPHEKRRQ